MYSEQQQYEQAPASQKRMYITDNFQNRYSEPKPKPTQIKPPKKQVKTKKAVKYSQNPYQQYITIIVLSLFIIAALLYCEVLIKDSTSQKTTYKQNDQQIIKKKIPKYTYPPQKVTYNPQDELKQKAKQLNSLTTNVPNNPYNSNSPIKQRVNSYQLCQYIKGSQESQCQKEIAFQQCKCNVMVEEKKTIHQNLAAQASNNCKIKSNILASDVAGMRWETTSYYPLIFQPYEVTPRKPVYTPTMKELEDLIPQKDFIIATHAGRKQYLQIFYKHLLKQKDKFAQWHLWVHTAVAADLQYIQKLAIENSWIKAIKVDGRVNPRLNLMRYYTYDCLKNKLYLKMDDDTLWMDQNFMDTMFKARFKLIKHLVVFSNIINTGIHTHLQQRFGVFQYPEQVEYDCIGNGWYKPQIGAALHKQFQESIQKGQVHKWMSFKEWVAMKFQRISINAFMYYSQTFRSFEYTQKRGDQLIITAQYTKMYNKPLVIIGNAISVHGAFYCQRKYFNIMHPQILQKYKKYANEL